MHPILWLLTNKLLVSVRMKDCENGGFFAHEKFRVQSAFHPRLLCNMEL